MRYLSSFLRRVSKTLKTPYEIKIRNNFRDRTNKFYLEASYGHFFSSFLKEYGEPFYFLDIGANQGLYSLIAAKNDFCKKVLSFEPVADTATLFHENILLNGSKHKIQVIQKALYNTNKTLKINFNPDHTGSATLRKHLIEKNNNFISIETIGCVDFNSIVGPFQGRYIVKIDVEGVEDIVIETLFQSLIADMICAIYVELDPNWLNIEQVLAQLKKAGFSKAWSNNKQSQDTLFIREI